MEITKLSALEIKEQIRLGKVACEEVIKSFIAKILDNKKYNAVLEVFEDAVENAKIMDDKIKNGFNGKLAGVPIIIKDNIIT